jgi:transcriptional regulator with XRE-family HTH domain
MQRLGEKLHILREYHGITQHHLAKQLHMSRSFISDMENGRKIPNVAHILKIADFFGVSADVLVLDDLEIDFDDG